MGIEALVNKRNKLAADMRDLNTKAETEDRSFTSEERTQWDAMVADISALDERIARAKTMGQFDDIDEPVRRLPDDMGGDDAHRSQDDDGQLTYEAVHRDYMRHGMGGLSQEERSVMMGGQADMSAAELRALGVGTGSAGGFTVPEGFGGRIIETMKQFGGVINVANILETGTGNDLPFPTNDDTGNVGELLAENAEADTQDPTFGQATLKAFKFSSKIVRTSLELLQDNEVDLEGYLANIMGKRIGRAASAYYCTGTGTAQPQGIAAGASNTATAAGASAITFADMLDLEHNVDPAYRVPGACRYLFNDATLKALKAIVDGDGRPLWLPSVADSAPATINGHGYQIDQGMPDVGTGNRSVVFGDMDAFTVRLVMAINMLRLTERYAEFGQVGFLAFARSDSRIMDQAGIAALVHP